MMWLYLTTILTAILGIFGWVINKDASWWLKGSMALLVIMALIAQVIIVKNEQKEKETNVYAGVLQGKEVTILSYSQNVFPKLKLGDSNTYINWQGQQGEPIFRIFGDNDLTIWIEDGSLKLSTKIRDNTGDLIAELIGNEWKVRKENLWDRNYNDNALEVIDEKGDVVLQVVIKEDYIQFAAKMYSSNGEGFAIGSSVFTEEDVLKHEQGESKIVAAAGGPTEIRVGDITGILEIRPPGQPLELTIEPIFKYPSELHLGELK